MMDRTISSRCFGQIVQRARQLYSLPAVAAQVIKLTEDDHIDVRALKQCVENDPALCAKILRVVNSSLFGLSRQVSDLGQALTLLGTKPLKLLVLGFSLPSELFSELARDVLAYYWRGALTKSVAARELSRRIFKRAGDEPFVAGLLHDIGVLVLLQEFGAPYLRFLETIVKGQKDLRSLEIATFGFDHTALSAQLLDQWHFPQNVVTAVGMPLDIQHICGLAPEQRGLPQILHLAELLCQVLARERTEAFSELMHVAEDYCQLKPRQLQTLVADVDSKVGQLADVLSLDLPDDRPYIELLLQAQAQLSEVAEAVARDNTVGKADDGQLGDATRQLRQTVRSRVGHAGGPAAAASTSRASTQSACVVDDIGFVGRVTAALAVCRQSRGPLSLLMIAMDDYDQLIVMRGAETVQSLGRLLATGARALCRGSGACLDLADGRLALILEDHDRSRAGEAGRCLIRSMHNWSKRPAGSGVSAVTISVGVATLGLAPKNFPAQALIDAASRCLFAARAAGGDTVKSIDVC